MKNFLSVDLEPWMCFYKNVPLKRELDGGHLVRSTRRILDILRRHDVKTTFFVLGAVFRWYPGLVDDIAAEGHEIGFHGGSHAPLWQGKLSEEISESREFLEKYDVAGFRASNVWIAPADMRTLHAHGFLYDSSIYSSAPPFTCEGIAEIPVSTYPLRTSVGSFPRNFTAALRSMEIPLGSGIFLGLLPARALRRLIGYYNSRGRSYCSFIHPWQIEPMPDWRGLGWDPLTAAYKLRVREETLSELFSSFDFAPMRQGIPRGETA